MSDLLSGTPNNFWGYSAVLLKGIEDCFLYRRRDCRSNG